MIVIEKSIIQQQQNYATKTPIVVKHSNLICSLLQRQFVAALGKKKRRKTKNKPEPFWYRECRSRSSRVTGQSFSSLCLPSCFFFLCVCVCVRDGTWLSSTNDRERDMEAHLFVLFQLDHANPFRPYKDGQWLLLLAAAFLKYNNITTTTTKIPPLPTESRM